MYIIFVCSGNTCRSPFAEGYFNSLDLKNITVSSRGLSVSGLPVSENSFLIAKEFGLSIEDHISVTFTKGDFNADYIFTMTEDLKNFLILNGGNPEKIKILGNGIPDPYGGDINVYRKCLTKLAEEIDNTVFSGLLTGIRIEDINIPDIPVVAQLEKEYFSEPWSEKSITESLDNNTEFFVAKKANSIVGYIGLNHILDEGYVTSIAVKEDFRNKGIGRLLLNKCISFGRKANLSFISLEVRKSNSSAVKLYEKSGFLKEGERKNFYSYPKEDAIIYTRRF